MEMKKVIIGGLLALLSGVLGIVSITYLHFYNPKLNYVLTMIFAYMFFIAIVTLGISVLSSIRSIKDLEREIEEIKKKTLNTVQS